RNRRRTSSLRRSRANRAPCHASPCRWSTSLPESHLQTPPPVPLPEAERGSRNLFLPLSASGRGTGGGVSSHARRAGTRHRALSAPVSRRLPARLSMNILEGRFSECSSRRASGGDLPSGAAPDPRDRPPRRLRVCLPLIVASWGTSHGLS